MRRECWLGLLVIVVIVQARSLGSSDSFHLPNDAKYFWCSELYNPYYPLSPINESLPFIPRHPPTPSPLSRVTPTYSLFPLTASSGGLLVWVNATACSPSCPSVQMQIRLSPQSEILSNVSVPTNQRVTVLFPMQSIAPNATSAVYYQFMQGMQIVDSGRVMISRYQARDDQVVIDYYSQGLLVNGLPYIPMGYYYYWSDTKRMIGLSQDEIHNAMQTPLPYNIPLPPPDDFMQYMDMVGSLGMRVHLDLHALAQSANSAQKW